MVLPNRIDRRGLLSRISILSPLEPREIDDLLKITITKRLRAGEILFRKGAEGSQAYAVMSGRLKVTASGEDGKEIVLRILDPGEVVGDIALLDSGPRSATVSAIEAAELLVLQRRDFLPFLERRPKVAVKLLARLGGWLRSLSEQLEDTLFLSIRARLAKKILALAASYGEPVAGGTRVTMRLSQSELANMVGATRESVNKELRRFSKHGAIRVENRYITVLDEEALHSASGYDV
jgi:CRP-like cAMP-binding protein